MICPNCNYSFDEFKEGSYILCESCTVKRNKTYLNAQIGLMGRLTSLTKDKDALRVLKMRQMAYMEELNGTL